MDPHLDGRLARIEHKVDALDDRISALWTNGLAALDRRVSHLEQAVDDRFHSGWGRLPPWALIIIGMLMALGGEGIRWILKLAG